MKDVVGSYHHSGRAYGLSGMNAECGDNMFLQNAGKNQYNMQCHYP
jgi:hypothetical protein